MHTYTVEFRIYGKDLDPEAVSLELGLQPSLVRSQRDLGDRANFKYALWAYDGRTSTNTPQWSSLEEGLIFLLQKLAPMRQKIAKFHQHNMIFWCGHFQSSFDGGPTLSPSILAALGDFGVPVFIDNYFEIDNKSDLRFDPTTEQSQSTKTYN